MTSPLVSILVPVYNREHLVGPCIQSALDQTVTDLEVVVVDNASTDGTWGVCQTFAKQDTRIRIFRNETNIGPVRNWHRCFEEARGQFGKVLFSDDLIHPVFLEKTLPLLEDPEVGFVFTAAEIGSEPGQGKVFFTWEDCPAVTSSVAFIEDALFGEAASPSCALFRLPDLRRNLVGDIPSPTIHDFFDHGSGPDVLLYLLTAKQYPKVAHISEPLAFLRSHAGSITIILKNEFITIRRQQAKIWFSRMYMDKLTTQKLLALAWLRACRHSKKWVSPSRIVQQYTEDFPWSWSAVIWVMGHKLGRYV